MTKQELIDEMKNRVIKLKKQIGLNKTVMNCPMLNEMNEKENLENEAVIKELERLVRLAEAK